METVPHKEAQDYSMMDLHAICARALMRSFMDNVPMDDAEIRIIVIGNYHVGDRVEFIHDIVGTVDTVVTFIDKSSARVLVNCDKFKSVWQSLSSAQKFGE